MASRDSYGLAKLNSHCPAMDLQPYVPPLDSRRVLLLNTNNSHLHYWTLPKRGIAVITGPKPQNAKPTSRPNVSPPSSPGPLYSSHALLQGHRVVWIEHMGERYALRVTKLGKLMLTK